MLVDENEDLSIRASQVSDRTASLNEKIPVSRTIINEVVRKEVGVISNNAEGDPRFVTTFVYPIQGDRRFAVKADAKTFAEGITVKKNAFNEESIRHSSLINAPSRS